MTITTEYHVIAYPRGARTRVAVIHAKTNEEAVKQATKQAKIREEYVDIYVEHRGCVIATVDAQGPISC